jgi:hypothetical protein
VMILELKSNLNLPTEAGRVEGEPRRLGKG